MMKRLLKKASTVELFHATSMESFESILQSGEIRPQEILNSDWANESYIDRFFNGDKEEYERRMNAYTGYTFFATDQYSSQFYGTRAADKAEFSDIYAILVFDVPEDIVLPDWSDMPEAETWQDSAREYGQVSVLGPVGTDKLKEIILTIRPVHVQFKTTVENWKEDLINRIQYEYDEDYMRDWMYNDLMNRFKSE